MPDLPEPDLPAVESAEDVAGGKFLRFRLLRWRDADGAPHVWETVERRGFRGAVLVIAVLRPSDRLVVIRQYRPPADRFVYEFPAGLVDAGETPEQAVLRELREETGYSARTTAVHPPCYTTPGLSNESVFMALAEIDETAPENANPRTRFDATENIETLLVPRADLAAFYRDETARGHAFDAKLAAYILGMR